MKMNKIWLSTVSVISAAALVLGIIGIVNSGDTKENAIPTINQQVKNINNTLPELENVNTELKEYLTEVENTVNTLQGELSAVGG